MTYTPTEWTNGDALAANKFNKMENGLKSADSSYVPTEWSAGDVITAEALNKIENGIAAAGSGGGGNPVAEEKDVNFIDYDGTIRYSYTAQEFAALDALPPNPDHTDMGLTSQGWNWTLADAKIQVQHDGTLCIGQHYITDSGATEIDVELPDETLLSTAISFSVNGTASISWGDGSSESVSGNSLSSSKVIPHTYSNTGKYTISILPGNSSAISLYCSDPCTLFGGFEIERGYPLATSSAHVPFRQCVKAVRLGRLSGSVNKAFILYGITSISVPIDSPLLNFDSCFFLRALVSPPTTGSPVLTAAYSLSKISLPKTVTTFNKRTYCYSSGVILIIPYGITTISSEALRSSSAFSRLVIPETVTKISSYAFNGCGGLKEIRFNGTVPPSMVSGSSASFDTGSDNHYKIYIPFSSLAEYLTKSGFPSASQYRYAIGYATYSNGATLPTQDSTEAYNVTWYASKADAIAQTNPITQGNGNEIYCRYVAVA